MLGVTFKYCARNVINRNNFEKVYVNVLILPILLLGYLTKISLNFFFSENRFQNVNFVCV